MTRKRFIKKLMAEGWDRDSANRRADYVSKQRGSDSYSRSWEAHEARQKLANSFISFAEAAHRSAVAVDQLVANLNFMAAKRSHNDA